MNVFSVLVLLAAICCTNVICAEVQWCEYINPGGPLQPVDRCATVRCGYGAECVSENGSAKCVCNRACPRLYQPTCGSDGRTYGNECELRAAICESKGKLQEAHNGACSDGRGDTQTTKKPCPTICSDIYMPICGTDGQTYSNDCVLNKAACTQGVAIGIEHQGECKQAGE